MLPLVGGDGVKQIITLFDYFRNSKFISSHTQLTPSLIAPFFQLPDPVGCSFLKRPFTPIDDSHLSLPFGPVPLCKFLLEHMGSEASLSTPPLHV